MKILEFLLLLVYTIVSMPSNDYVNLEHFNASKKLLKRGIRRGIGTEIQRCTDIIKSHSGVRRFGREKMLKAKYFQTCKGMAIFTTVRVGAFLVGHRGKGLVLRRFSPGNWSAPSAFIVGGMEVGLTLGIESINYVVFLNTEEEVQKFYISEASWTVKASVTVWDGILGEAVGPLKGLAFSHGIALGPVSLGGMKVRPDNPANNEEYGPFSIPERILNEANLFPRNIGILFSALRGAEGLLT